MTVMTMINISKHLEFYLSAKSKNLSSKMFGVCNTKYKVHVTMYKLSYTEHYELEIDVIEMSCYNVCVQQVQINKHYD